MIPPSLTFSVFTLITSSQPLCFLFSLLFLSTCCSSLHQPVLYFKHLKMMQLSRKYGTASIITVKIHYHPLHQCCRSDMSDVWFISLLVFSLQCKQKCVFYLSLHTPASSGLLFHQGDDSASCRSPALNGSLPDVPLKPNSHCSYWAHITPAADNSQTHLCNLRCNSLFLGAV